ncbi:glutathione S-transferase family protein [bacterium]|nr:glutathione S-transferase family protein [bacterium]
MSYKLYSTLRSPYARKVRIALLEKKIAYEEINVDLNNKPADFLKHNPLGSVPSLVTGDGLMLPDSTLILRYLEEKHPTPSLVSSHLKNETWAWEEWGDRLCDEYVRLFHAGQTGADERAMRITQAIITMLGEALQNKEYILGQYSLADIAMAASMKWMDFRLKHDWSKLPAPVLNWYKRLDERESFIKTYPQLA